MSKFHDEKVKCIKCGKEFDFRMWESVNVSLDRSMKEKVKDLSFLDSVCPYCGNKAKVIYPFLYHDMKKGIWMHFCGKEGINEVLKALDRIKELPDFSTIDYESKYKYRVTYDLNDFVEKLIAFDNNIDDKIVMIFKLIFMSNNENNETSGFKNMWLNKVGKKEFSWKVLSEDNKMYLMTISNSLYYAIEKDFKNDIIEDKSRVIDLEWAYKILEARNKKDNKKHKKTK